jgi:hypothetical protein
MGFLSCSKIAPITIHVVSHSILKGFVKLGKTSNGVKICFSFNKVKAFSGSFSHFKLIIFLAISVNRAAIVLKNFTNLL